MLDTGLGSPEWVLLGIGAAAGFIVSAIAFFSMVLRLVRRNAELTMQVKHECAALERAGAALDMRFRATAQDALSQTSEQFLQLAQEKLKSATKDSAHDLEKRQKAIEGIIDPVNKALNLMDEKIQQLEKARIGAYSELQTNLKAMADDQIRLRRETSSLVQALRSPSTRGQWGEMQLKKCLEMAGMQEGVHFEQQVSTDNGQRPDVIVKLSGGQIIVIDAKAPIEGYLDALKDGLSEDQRTEALDRHARHVRGHMRALGSKAYWQQFTTPEFVVMFLPGESYFSAALERDPSLIESGVNEKVIPATPTTLISLLKAVMYGWRQEALAQNAQEISSLGSELYERISTFASHLGRVGKGLDGAMEAYNKAVSSLENRVLVTARKFEELQAAPQGKEIETLEPLVQSARKLAAPELMETRLLSGDDHSEKRRA